MTDQISLDAQALGSALAILQREQVTCVPTERERRLYRWFNICVYSMAVVFVLVVSMVGAVDGGEGSGPFHIVFGLLSLVAAALMLATIVLFFLNWGLIRKLYRHAQLRKRLNLADYFASAFSAERKATVVGNVVTLLTFIAGCLLILVSFFGAVGIAIGESRGQAMGPLASVFVATFLVGVSFISFRYMRRGKQRLEVVLRLERTLTEQAGPGHEAKEVKLSPEEYNAIATLERQHIIRDRENSIASARKQADGPGYLCQSSRQMHLAKSKLPPELLVKVEGAIAELLADPLPAAAAKDARTGSTTIPVADTGLRIQYDVDRNRHLVRLYDLQTERGASVAALGGANGLS